MPLKPLRVYWSNGLKQGRKNFGDWIGPELVRALSGREIEHCPPSKADLLSVGSILQKLDNRFWKKRVHVWGSGFIEMPSDILARHHFHAVRGKETLARVEPGVTTPALGDPGLLSHLLLPEYRDISRTVRLGIVPHYKDKNDAEVLALHRRFPGSTLIDVLDEPVSVLRQIAGCELIVSSSLHGLVVADAFGLPSQWLKCGDRVRGEDFKFRDYYSVFGIGAPTPMRPCDVTDASLDQLSVAPPRPGLPGLQKALIESFPFHH
jgi:pyruvyltransferase